MACVAWIEDDHDRISSLVKLLEKDGCRIEPFGSWKEVQDRIDRVCACDAIILDIILPPIGDDPYMGLAILEQLRKEQGYTGPVIVCSRVQNPVVIHQLEELGVASILRKPVRPSVLYNAVKKAMGSD